MRVNDDDFVLHEDHFDIDVEVLEQGDVGLKVVWNEGAAARLSKLEKNPLASRDVADNSPPELGFMHAPPVIRLRLYPAALALAFPDKKLEMHYLLASAGEIEPSPMMEEV